MATAAPIRKVSKLRPRKIIQRPRLFTLLDDSSNRVRMLIASAGYGKTTLAEQWVARDGRRNVWFTARSASVDVAGLALGVARAATDLFPGCDERLRAHLRAVPNPADRVDVLAEIVAEELETWAPTDWLVLDDYHELVGGVDAERFIEHLVAISPIQLLIASRQRPTWVTGRDILYGEVLELNQTALAMDTQEATELLEGRSAASASGLVALADGWPAVIALASVTDAETAGDAEVPDALYSFFADEVFAALGDDVKAGLATLAVAPILDRELADKLLGEAVAKVVCEAALQVGILEERGTRLELHPLARSFLDDRRSALSVASTRSPATACCIYYISRRGWDAAFEVIARRDLTDEYQTLLAHALDELLAAGQLSTLETWCNQAEAARVEQPLVLIAKAEIALRRGRLAEAQALAELAAPRSETYAFRGMSLAGRAAHLDCREEVALELYRRAEAVATSDSEHRDALHGQFLCALGLESRESFEILEALRAGMEPGDVRDLVRVAAGEIACQVHFGPLHLAGAEVARELVRSVADPIVRAAFLNGYSYALALSARYVEAEPVVAAFLDEIERYQLDFAVPYAFINGSMVRVGQRQWKQAHAHLDRAVSTARLTRNAYAEHVCYALRVTTLVQQGDSRRALSIEVPDLHRATSAARAEVLTSRAVALTAAERVGEARTLTEEARTRTPILETSILIEGLEAVAALKSGDRSATTLIDQYVRSAFTSGALGVLVMTYRAFPDLLAALLVGSERDHFQALVLRVGDGDLCSAIGQPLGMSETDLQIRLTPRQREVYELLRQGLTNRQIANTLVISEATARLHTHHVYDKVGTRSRVAIAVQAALERSPQATSATEESSDSSS